MSAQEGMSMVMFLVSLFLATHVAYAHSPIAGAVVITTGLVSLVICLLKLVFYLLKEDNMKTNSRILFHLNGASGIFKRFDGYLRLSALAVVAVAVLIVSSLASSVVYAEDGNANIANQYEPVTFNPEYQLPETEQVEWFDQIGQHNLWDGMGDNIQGEYGEFYMIGYDGVIMDYNSFEKDDPFTRIELVYYMAKILTLNRDQSVAIPKDIDPNSIYADWWQRAGKTGIFNFMLDSDGKFYPNRRITRADLSYVFMEYWKLIGLDKILENPPADFYESYYKNLYDTRTVVDLDQYSEHWAYPSMIMVHKLGLVGYMLTESMEYVRDETKDFGTLNVYTLNPDHEMTEGEVATVFSRLTARNSNVIWAVNEFPYDYPSHSKSGADLSFQAKAVLGPRYKWEIEFPVKRGEHGGANFFVAGGLETIGEGEYNGRRYVIRAPKNR